MKKFIRITESQLKRILDNVIVEQTTAPGTAIAAPAPAAPKASNEQQIANELHDDAEGRDLKGFLENIKKINSTAVYWNVNSALKQNPNKLDLAQTINSICNYYTDITFVKQIADYLKGLGLNVSYQAENNKFKRDTFVLTAAAAPATAAVKSVAPQKKKYQFQPNEKFPLKFGQTGENIKMIQQQLGVTPLTGNFWVKTEAAVKKAVPEYTRQNGISEDIWNKIFGAKPRVQADVVRTGATAPVAPTAPTSLATG